MKQLHIPVMVTEVIRELDIKPNGIYIDCTLGLAGHSIAISKATTPQPRIIGLEVDEEAIEQAKINVKNNMANIKILKESFLNLESSIQPSITASGVDGVLIDLGISSLQLNSAKKGFSFKMNSPLDMRFDTQEKLTAEYIVNNYSFKKLYQILKTFGEEKSAKNIATHIINSRPIKTTLQLSQIIINVKGENNRKLLHPATKTFQALRIAVNQELERLPTVLNSATKILRSGGRLVIISYHSLEDRIVKNFIGHEKSKCICDPKIPVCVCHHKPRLKTTGKNFYKPTNEEINRNFSSRSAILRVAEKL